MKIAMNESILGVDGTEVKDGEKTLVLADVIITSMTAQLKSETEDTGENMLKKWDLAERAHKGRGDVMDITVEEATLIKDRVRKVFASTVIYANVHRIIEAAGK